MKRKILFALICTVPVLLLTDVWQVFRYRSLQSELVRLEEEQREVLEENKRNIAGIAALQSPERIDSLARDQLDLEKAENSETIRILLPQRGRNQDGS
ncbi:MAG: septum formation initiator family protein [Spirochaetia bacterium]